MTHLPIHAAGLQGRGTDETVVDRVISSYTTSVKSLVHNRRQRIQNASSVKGSRQALLIAMTETTHQTSLPFATEEVTTVKPFLQEMGMVAAEGIEQTDEVLRNISTCQIIHFAGHGMSHPSDPASSCLLTKDWETNPLTMEKLRKERLQRESQFLAYLSSCSTGAIKNYRLADESIHLISACQLAGFRHVIGALWEVSDQHCVDVARIVYQTLKEKGLTDKAVATGLHKATRYVHDEHKSANQRGVTSDPHDSPWEGCSACGFSSQAGEASILLLGSICPSWGINTGHRILWYIGPHFLSC